MKEKDTVSSEDAGEVWRCVDCKDFKDINSRILECERCEEHHCSKCIKLSDTEYDILNARDDIHWYCNKCEQKVLRSIHLDIHIRLLRTVKPQLYTKIKQSACIKYIKVNTYFGTTF